MTGDNQKYHECNLWMQLGALKHDVRWIEEIYYTSLMYIFKTFQIRKIKENPIYHQKCGTVIRSLYV